MAQCESHSAHDEMLQTIKRQITELFSRVSVVEKNYTEMKVFVDMTLQSVTRIETKLDAKLDGPLPQLIPAKSSFWDSKAGQSIPWIVGLIAVVTIIALAGQNVAHTLTATKDLIPK